MNVISRLSLLLVGALLFPAVHAGTSSEPEITDASGDAPAAVDILGVWFSLPATPATTTGERAVDCNLNACGDGFTVTMKLRDLEAGSPLADTDPASVRYHYTVRFTPSSWGAEVAVECIVNLAHYGLAQPVGWGGPELSPGTSCQVMDQGATGSAYDVTTGRFIFGTRSDNFALLATHLDLAADTLSFTLVEDLSDIGSGVTISGVSASTSLGIVRTSDTPLLTRIPADSTDVGSDWTM